MPTFAIRGGSSPGSGSGETIPTATIITSGPFNANAFDRVRYNPTAGTFTINMPAAPAFDTQVGVKNVTSDLTAITVSGNGSNVEDPTTSSFAASSTVIGDGASIVWEYDGTSWVIIQESYGVPTSPGSGAGSERFGAGAVASGANATAFGNAASAGFDDSIAYGSGATTVAANDGQWGAAARPVDFQSYRQLALGYASVAVDTDTVTTPQAIIGVTDTTVPRTITLQTATLKSGRSITINDESGAAGTNNITIVTQGTETIDGAASAVIDQDNGSVQLYSDGSNWFTSAAAAADPFAALTQGSVVFVGAGGVAAEDNANFFWDDAADRLSIAGTISVLGAGVRSEQYGLNAQASALDSTALGNAAIASGSRSVAVGEDAKSQGSDSTAIGKSAIATSVGSTAVGQGASALANVGTAIGKLASAASLRDTALGADTSASGSDSTAVGYTASSGFRSVALGKGATSTGTGSVAVGEAATTVAFANAIAIGSGATAVAANDGQWGTSAAPVNFRSYGTSEWGAGGFAKAVGSAGDMSFDNGTVTSPGVKFYVAANKNFGIEATATDGLRFIEDLDEAGAAVRMSIDPGGFVGIGTVAPNAALDVRGTPGAVVGGSASGLLHVTNPSALANANAVITGHNLFGGNKQLWYLGSVSGSNDDIAFINRQNAALSFYTNSIERVRIDSVGDTAFTGAVSAGSVTGTAIGSGLDAALRAVSTGPSVEIRETDAALDEKSWVFLAIGGGFSFRAANDANSATETWMQVDRTGAIVDKVAFLNGNVEITDFTSLGAASPSVKMKKLTGTSPAAEGGTTNITHGLTLGKIIGLQVLVTADNGNLIPPGLVFASEFEYDVFISATDVVIRLSGTNSGVMLSNAIVVLLIHEE